MHLESISNQAKLPWFNIWHKKIPAKTHISSKNEVLQCLQNSIPMLAEKHVLFYCFQLISIYFETVNKNDSNVSKDDA